MMRAVAQIGLIALGVAALLFLVREPGRPAQSMVDPDRATVQRLIDSLHRVDQVRSESLYVYAAAVGRLRGDSLRRALVRRAAARRTALVSRGLLPLQAGGDTTEQIEASQRTLLIADSACRAEADSLQGALAGCEAERAFESDASAQQIGEAHARADSTARVSAGRAQRWGIAGVLFGILVALGAAVAM